jgi:hypothetical protein
MIQEKFNEQCTSGRLDEAQINMPAGGLLFT